MWKEPRRRRPGTPPLTMSRTPRTETKTPAQLVGRRASLRKAAEATATITGADAWMREALMAVVRWRPT